MQRLWSIEEQAFNDPASGFALEFISDPTDERDRILIMRLHNAARDKVLVITFERNGLRLSSNVESVDTAAGAAMVARAAAVASGGVSDGAARAAAALAEQENSEAMAGDIDRQGPSLISPEGVAALTIPEPDDGAVVHPDGSVTRPGEPVEPEGLYKGVSF